MFLRQFYLFAALLLSTVSVHANDLEASIFLSDLNVVQSVFEAKYAPKAWKAERFNWNFPAEVDKVRAQITSGKIKTVKEYQIALRALLQTAQDYHVGVTFVSTEKATLPLDIRAAEGRYFLVYINRDLLPLSSFPFEVGDEVVGFDGKPIQTVINEMKESLGLNTPETLQTMAEYYLTRRSGRGGWVVPQGPVMIEVKAKTSGRVSSRQLIWLYTPERIHYDLKTPMQTTALQKVKNMTMAPGFQNELSLFATEPTSTNLNPHQIGERESFVPELGKKIWEGEAAAFKAYIFETAEGKSVGYVRIPTYSASDAESAEFRGLIEHFKDNTEALVIDQVSNPGGSVFYLYGLVSMLTDQPLKTPRHRMSLNQAEVLEALQGVDEANKITDDSTARAALGWSLDGYVTDFNVAQFFLNYLRFKVTEWSAGKKLSAPHFLGVDYINPHPEVNYTKPILILINELDFSGGDFFPAIMQDNKRATILGTRTAGAGGYVTSVTYPNQLGVASLSLTASIAERVNLQPIENLGVTPDVPHTFTVRDIQENYADYAAKVLTTLKTML